MILSATLKKDCANGDVVRYVDSFGGKHSFLSLPVEIKACDLPDPPPALLRISLDWYQEPRSQAAPMFGADRGSAKAPLRTVEPGDMVTVVKSRVSGVQSPPEWLEQHLGRTGAVAWVTPGGANVDLGDETVWFSYDELERAL
jgi:hypothetical protein